jgi:hypothetical protein
LEKQIKKIKEEVKELENAYEVFYKKKKASNFENVLSETFDVINSSATLLRLLCDNNKDMIYAYNQIHVMKLSNRYQGGNDLLNDIIDLKCNGCTLYINNKENTNECIVCGKYFCHECFNEFEHKNICNACHLDME